MWSRSSTEKSRSENFVREYAGKVLPCTTAKIFQWDGSPISIGGTLHKSASPLRFSSRGNSLIKKVFGFAPGGPVSRFRCFGTKMKPKRTILCVDDNEQSLSIRKVMLETRGYRVVTCTGGEEALERFKNGGVDLVLTDLVAPGPDGTKLIEEIKRISPHTPVILLSGKVKIYDRDSKADVFLPKGMYAPVELLERIRVLLVRKRGPKRVQAQVAQSPSQTSAA
jgi:two-component system response regulator CpxR